MVVPWKIIIEVLVKLLGFAIGYVDKENKARANFVIFVQKMEEAGIISATTKMQQEDRLKSLAEKRKEAQNNP